MTTWPRCTLTTWGKSATCREQGEGGGGVGRPVRPSVRVCLVAYTLATLTNTSLTSFHHHIAHTDTHAQSAHAHTLSPCILLQGHPVPLDLLPPLRVVAAECLPCCRAASRVCTLPRDLPPSPTGCTPRRALSVLTSGRPAHARRHGEEHRACRGRWPRAAVRMNTALGNAQNGLTTLPPAYAPPLVAPPAAAPQLGCGLLRQMRTVASSLPDANVSPSGAWRTAQMGPWWPRRLSSSAPVS